MSKFTFRLKEFFLRDVLPHSSRYQVILYAGFKTDRLKTKNTLNRFKKTTYLKCFKVAAAMQVFVDSIWWEGSLLHTLAWNSAISRNTA